MTPQKINGNENLLAGHDIYVSNYHSPKPQVIHLYPDTIKDLIEGLAFCVEEYSEKEPNRLDDLTYIEKEEKNRLNSLSEEYFDDIVNEQLVYFRTLDDFIKDPKNKSLRNIYQNIAAIIRFRIAVIKRQYDTFEEIISAICNEILESKGQRLKGSEHLCIVFMNYMYWACDIGKRVDDSVKAT